MARITEPREYKHRTREEIYEALRRFCHAAWGTHEPGERTVFTIPPDDQDADIILYDAAHELLEARVRIVALEAEVAALRLSASFAYAYVDATKDKINDL